MTSCLFRAIPINPILLQGTTLEMKLGHFWTSPFWLLVSSLGKNFSMPCLMAQVHLIKCTRVSAIQHPHNGEMPWIVHMWSPCSGLRLSTLIVIIINWYLTTWLNHRFAFDLNDDHQMSTSTFSEFFTQFYVHTYIVSSSMSTISIRKNGWTTQTWRYINAKTKWMCAIKYMAHWFMKDSVT